MDSLPHVLCSEGKTTDVSVIVPVYQNSETVAELWDRLVDVFNSNEITFEVVFVNDACPRGSLEVLRTIVERDARVGVVDLMENIGQNRAVLVGLGLARGRFSVIIDADLQDPPEAILVLLDKIREGHAVVFAGRRGRYQPLPRLITSRLYKRLIHFVTGVPVDGGIFMIMNDATRRLIVAQSPPFIVPTIGLLAVPHCSVPVARSRREKGRSAYTSWKRTKIGLEAIAWALRWRLVQNSRSAAGTLPPDDGRIREMFGERFSTPSPRGEEPRERDCQGV